jgi:hypothetical protein
MPYGLRATEAILATYVVVLFLLWFYLQQLWVSALLVISSVIISRVRDFLPRLPLNIGGKFFCASRRRDRNKKG